MWRSVDRYEYMSTLRHMPRSTDRERLIQLAHRRAGLTTREVNAAGIHTQSLSRLVNEGVLERVTRGQYRLPTTQITEHHGLAVVAATAPRGVICLLSALSFHGIGTQLPYQVWIALDRRVRQPAARNPPLRVVRFSGQALASGIETHRIEGRAVRIYSVAKTLADCFKYRNKIGLDAAFEALREAWRARRFTMGEITKYARICRVERVMKPYLEALVA